MSFQILVLNDDKNMYDLIQNLITELTCRVDWARSGAEANEKMQSQNFDIAIVDFRLPDCDGMTWMFEQRKKGCEIPFVFLTDIPMTLRYQTRLRNLLKVDSVLHKPISSRKFIDLIKSVLKLTEEASEYEKSINETIENSKLAGDEHTVSDSKTIEFSLKTRLLSMTLDMEKSAIDEREEDVYHQKLEFLDQLPSLMRDFADRLEEASRAGWTKEQIYKAWLAAHSIRATSGSLTIEGIPEVFECLELTFKEMHDVLSVNQTKYEAIV